MCSCSRSGALLAWIPLLSGPRCWPARTPHTACPFRTHHRVRVHVLSTPRCPCHLRSSPRARSLVSRGCHACGSRCPTAGTIIYDGRALEVREDREDHGRGVGTGSPAPARSAPVYHGGGGGNRVFVGNLSWDVSHESAHRIPKHTHQHSRAQTHTHMMLHCATTNQSGVNQPCSAGFVSSPE